MAAPAMRPEAIRLPTTLRASLSSFVFPVQPISQPAKPPASWPMVIGMGRYMPRANASMGTPAM